MKRGQIAADQAVLADPAHGLESGIGRYDALATIGQHDPFVGSLEHDKSLAQLPDQTGLVA